MSDNSSNKQEQGGEKDDANIGLSVILHCKIVRADGTVREEFDARGVINTGGMNDNE